MHISKVVLDQFTTFSRNSQPQNALNKNIPLNTYQSNHFQDPSHLTPIPDFNYHSTIYNTGPTLPALVSQYISPNKQIQDCDLQTFSLMCKSFMDSPKTNKSRSKMNIQGKRQEKLGEKNTLNVSKNPRRKVSVQESLQSDNLESENDCSPHGSDRTKDGPKKYKTYSKEEKREIINHIHEHGMDYALEYFKASDPKLTKRKLTLWQTNIDKKKNTKGKTTNDIARDQGLITWYHEFKEQYHRPPTRREIIDKSLTLSQVPEFRASKGWVDKIIKRLNFEVTLIKVKSPENIIKKRKISKTSETAVTSRKISIESEEKETTAETASVGQIIMFSDEYTMKSPSEIENNDISMFLSFTAEQNQSRNFETSDEINFFNRRKDL